LVEITHTPIQPQRYIEAVRHESNGAVVTFVGSVRDFSSSGRKALHLHNDPSAEELAQKELGQIADEIRSRWQLGSVAIAHRLGKLDLGEITLVVAIGAPHRQEAFHACQYAVDRFKDVVSAWETEVLEGKETV